MYESFYGLKRKPFELHPDPDYVYMSPGHDNVYTHLRYATEEGKGFVVITGEIGSGKTTLINFLLRRIPHGIEMAVVNTPAVAPVQFLRMMCGKFGLGTKRASKLELLEAFKQYLLECHEGGRRVLLIVDEAQNLPVRTIEEIRMLSNLEAGRDRRLQIVLVGQPELREKLKKKGLEQFLQRVTVHCHLEGLRREDVKDYVRHRLTVAGANHPKIFDDDALDALYRHSGGTPRLVNILCDTALVYGFGEARTKIDRKLIEVVAESRHAGGLFADERPADAGEDASDPEEGSLPTELQERIRIAEGRIRAVESWAEGVTTRLGALSHSSHRLAVIIRALKKYVDEQIGAKSHATDDPSQEHRPDSPLEQPRLRRIFGGKW